MLAEQQAVDSTGGIALAYAPCMHNAILPLSLSILFLACGDDGEPTRPADGTVKAWGACMWDGQIVPELCEPDLACSYHGVCSPVCETLADCTALPGFDVDCVSTAGATICAPLCNEAKECPKTDGADLTCYQFQCIGES